MQSPALCRPCCGRRVGVRPACRTACSAVQAPAPAASSSFPAGASAPCRLPAELQSRLDESSQSWLRHCVERPLVDRLTGSRIHLLGTAAFAPPTSAAELQRVLDVLRPSVLALEQPYDEAARDGMPYPDVIRLLRDWHLDAVQGNEDGTAATQLAGAAVQRLAAAVQALRAPPQARIGRDLLDPFETFGLYGAADLVVRPQQLVHVAELFGFVPGEDYGALVAAAQELDVQVTFGGRLSRAVWRTGGMWWHVCWGAFEAGRARRDGAGWGAMVRGSTGGGQRGGRGWEGAEGRGAGGGGRGWRWARAQACDAG